MGQRRICIWVCDNCVESVNFQALLPETKYNSLLTSFTENVSQCINDLVPNLIKEHLNDNVKQAVTDSLPSYRDALINAQITDTKETSYQFVLTGIPESATSFSQQIEDDSKIVEEIIEHVGLQPSGNISAKRMLGKSLNPEHNVRRI